MWYQNGYDLLLYEMMNRDIYWRHNVDVMAVGIDFLYGAFVTECWHTDNLLRKCSSQYPELQVVILSNGDVQISALMLSCSGE